MSFRNQSSSSEDAIDDEPQQGPNYFGEIWFNILQIILQSEGNKITNIFQISFNLRLRLSNTRTTRLSNYLERPSGFFDAL